MSAVSLQVSPLRARVDQPLSVRVTGLAPYAEADLLSSTVDGALARWAARSRFRADGAGTLDLRRDAPLPGSSYSGIDPTGPLWSVQGDGTALFAKKRPTPLRFRFAVEVDGAETAVVEDVQRHFGEHVVEEVVSDEDVLGSLFLPGAGQRAAAVPGVLLLGGSDGGALDHAASLLADEGYAVLALRYFGVEDRPASLVGIDLDQIDRAVAWLLGRPEVGGPQIAVVGISRGAELALQLAAENDGVGPVVAVAPSALRQPGLSANYTDFTRPAWVRGGTALPFNGSKLGVRDWLGTCWDMVRRRPMRQVDTFRADLRHPDRVRRAAIEVERCTGPLLLVSGEEDQLWPSAEFADLILQRLHSRGRAGVAQDVRYPDVGHFVGFPMGIPGLPPANRMRPSAFFAIDFGGEAAAHAVAARDAWARQLEFLSRWRAGLPEGLVSAPAEPVPPGASGGAERSAR